MGTEEAALMRKSRCTGQMSTSGASLQKVPIQVRKTKFNSCNKKKHWHVSCGFLNLICAFRVWALLRVFKQQTVPGWWTDDCGRLLPPRGRRVEACILDEGEEDGVWCCGDKWLYLCDGGIFLLKRDLSAKHWKIRPRAGLLGDCRDSSQPSQIPRMCLCLCRLVANICHILFVVSFYQIKYSQCSINTHSIHRNVPRAVQGYMNLPMDFVFFVVVFGKINTKVLKLVQEIFNLQTVVSLNSWCHSKKKKNPLCLALCCPDYSSIFCSCDGYSDHVLIFS